MFIFSMSFPFSLEFFTCQLCFQVPGRLYPIEMEFCPVVKDYDSSKSERLDPSPYLRIMQRIEKKVSVISKIQVCYAYLTLIHSSLAYC